MLVSDARAIEAVTQTLRGLIAAGADVILPGTPVVTGPPDKAVDAVDRPLVNLFLYQASIDGELRNQPSRDLNPGETADPPLPLVLRYLITPYLRDGDDLTAHRLLGASLQSLQAHPVLSRTELAAQSYSDVADQVERIRLTWQPLEEKDLFSLWSIFQTPYRLSTAFEVRVVFIDSGRPSRTPTPVLRRGPDDRGPVAGASTASPFPALTSAVPANNQPAALAGETVQLLGANLTATTVTVQLSHPLLAAPLTPTAVPVGAAEVDFTMPAGPAGIWSATVTLSTTGQPDQVTNAVPLAVAPKITGAPLAATRDAAGNAVLQVTADPPVLPEQHALLLAGDLAVTPDPALGGIGATSVAFTLPGIAPGSYLLRLRVDGVDSELINRTVQPPAFDATQILTVT